MELQRDPFGLLSLTLADGTRHDGLLAVRAFPLLAPDEGIALVGQDGQERLWIEHLRDLPDAARGTLEEALKAHVFTPIIVRLDRVSTFATPCTWTVDTDRGTTQFTLPDESAIRRLPDGGLLITDHLGIHYRIPKLKDLDSASRRLLDRFL